MSELKQTDLSKRLRAKANQPFGPEDFMLLTQAADEIERYYTGMLNWKATAEAQSAQPEATKPAQDLGAAILARQIIQDTNDTLREQYEALVQLKAENDQLRAALASPVDELVAGDRVDAERTGTLYQAVQRAAGELPEGWTICLEIERDAGTVELIDPEGNRKLIDGNDGYLCQAVNEATNAAIQAQKDGHG